MDLGSEFCIFFICSLPSSSVLIYVVHPDILNLGSVCRKKAFFLELKKLEGESGEMWGNREKREMVWER